MLSKVEIDILKHLWDENLIDPMNSRTIRNISKGIDLNYYRIRTNVNHLCDLGLIKKGFKERSSFTFFISEDGIEMVNK